MGNILQGIALEYIIYPVLSTILTAIIGFATMKWQQWTGQQIEEKKKRDLHMAAENAVKWAINELLGGKVPVTQVDRMKVLDVAPQYMVDKVPDALAHFGINANSSILLDIIKTKLPIIGLDVEKK